MKDINKTKQILLKELQELRKTHEELKASIEKEKTPRQESDETRPMNEKEYRSFFDNMLNGVAYCKMIDHAGQPQDFIYLNVNRAFETLTGLKNVKGKKVSEVIPDIQKTDYPLIQIYGRVAQTGNSETFEMFVQALNMWFSVAVYCPENGYFVSIFEVITERKKAEASIRESEEKYRILFNNSEVGMFRTRLDGSEILECNEKYLKIFNYSPEEVLGLPSVNLWADKGERDEMVKILNAEGYVSDFECGMLNKQGEVRRCITSLRLYRDTGILEGSIQDITERKKAEENLRNSENKLRSILDATPFPIAIVDLQDDNIYFWSKSAMTFGVGSKHCQMSVKTTTG